MGDVSFAFRSVCHVFGLKIPCGLPPLIFCNLFSNTVEVSCAFPLCVSKKLDGYFRINDEALFAGQVGVHCVQFSEYSCIFRGKFTTLE